ncbi:MAG TPA: hypothetical protein PLR06_01205 [Cyclobacteriaceae bacterium]|nr:hypothetical protein [Cyclobacteriaceae bacterium]
MKSKTTLSELTPEEMVDSFVFPIALSPEEKKIADRELNEARRKRQLNMTEHERLLLRLMQLRYRLENYIQQEPYDSKLGFSYFLNEYLNIVDKRRKEFANDIDIHETLLSQLMNNRREPNESIMVRLEIHSNNVIPAIHWLKLVEKSKEHDIRTNAKLRQKERRYVRNKLELSGK